MKYFFVYSKQIDSVIAIGDSIDIVNKYISQFNISENNIEIFSKNLINGLEKESLTLLELSYINSDIVLTSMEDIYYRKYLCKLYDDMKTTISSLILYSNIGILTDSQKNDLKHMSKLLYNNMSTYEEFLDNLDKSILFEKIIQNPIMMHKIIMEDISMNQRYNELREL